MPAPTPPPTVDNLTEAEIAKLLQTPEAQVILARAEQLIENRLAKSPLDQLATELNTLVPGWKTSEFWMTLFGHVGLVLAALTGIIPAQWAALAAAASQAAYTLSRGLAKGGQGN